MTDVRERAESIWRAGVAAVDSQRLVERSIHRDGSVLYVCGCAIDLADVRRLAVVGAGKAGAGMARAVERIVGDAVPADRRCGWVNVPADCVAELNWIQLHAARPAGVNEPTQAGVDGALRILEIAQSLRQSDACLVLLSGGGSALLPCPATGVSLSDKQRLTRMLMHAGARIDELNCVRKHLSLIKGGKLAAACRAGTCIALIVSDVIGDPLDVIASGPTVADSSTAEDALRVLEKYSPDHVADSVWHALQKECGAHPPAATSRFENRVIGNNQTALSAAATRAAESGYAVHSLGSANAGEARQVGVELADLCLSIRDGRGPVSPPAVVLSGGEPVVHLRPTDLPRKGGRNQELVLSACRRLWDDGMSRLCILSGGTDGEDGPTDAAGAFGDAATIATARRSSIDPDEYLAVNNSYAFFEQTGGLLKTGPTHTNVMDLRVCVVE